MKDMRLWHDNDYPRRARAIVTAAQRNPHTLCWRCQQPLAQHPPHKTGRPATWHAGHIIDGDPHSPLAAEASTCNQQAGGRITGRTTRSLTERSSPNA
jgi:hypothetical protein